MKTYFSKRHGVVHVVTNEWLLATCCDLSIDPRSWEHRESWPVAIPTCLWCVGHRAHR